MADPTFTRWRRVCELLDALLDVPTGQREAMLARLAGEDQALRREVASLLEADDRAGSFLASPAAAQGAVLLAPAGAMANGVDHDIGRTVGAWRLLRAIGEGGMGRVFVAERWDGQFTQHAALKLMKGDRLGGHARSRFLHERQILAHLDHPHIARLLDGGVTPEGAPYFVMELVDGRTITTFVAEEHCDVRARLALFLAVCEAVSYAHTRLVVHRDLKPSNILVDQSARPRLLDFGIAKLLAADGDAEPFTGTAAQLMTPEYAAPEQIRGDVVTTATDVWALGVLLFELLTGRRPFKGRGALPGDLARAILDSDPPRPSVAVDASCPYDGRALRGDLDRIALTAMQKEPARRYPSVDALGADLRRYLEGQPVLARGNALGYRAGKFLRRHRLGVAAAVLLVASLVGGLVSTMLETRRAEAARREAEQQRERAELRFDDVRRLANALLFDVSDAVADLPGGAGARALVASKALEYLDALARDSSDDPSLDAELAAAYERVGDASLASGDPPKARESYERAYRIRRRLARTRSDDPAAHLALSAALRKLGDGTFLTGARDSAIARYVGAAAVADSLHATRAGGQATDRELVAAHGRLCERLDAGEDVHRARAACRRAATVGELLLRRDPNDARLRTRVAAAAGRLATLLGQAPRSATADATGQVETERRALGLGQYDFATHPHIGLWRLRPKAGPRYSPFTTLRCEPVGRGIRYRYFDDLGRLVMTMTFMAEGTPTPIYGPDGKQFATITGRRLDERHFESWGEGLPYIYELGTISEDGMTWTSEARMRNPRGQEYTDVDVWEKQSPTPR